MIEAVRASRRGEHEVLVGGPQGYGKTTAYRVAEELPADLNNPLVYYRVRPRRHARGS